MLDDFAVFILSHGRPDKVFTYKELLRGGYSGRIYIVIDNEDKTAEEYRKKYGEIVITFDKAKIAETFDEGDNFQDRRAVIYARNACFDIARDLGIKYFMQLDDDYYEIRYQFNARNEYANFSLCLDLDNIFLSLLSFYKSIKCVTVAISQTGDFIGGALGSYGKKLVLHRKAMNTFIFSADSDFRFFGRINEDVNGYTAHQNKGNLFFTVPNLAIDQKTTQKNSGGMSEMYLDSGTYIKSFYSVMYLPSAVKVGMMGESHRRLHHSIKWDNAVPAIISEQYRKS